MEATIRMRRRQTDLATAKMFLDSQTDFPTEMNEWVPELLLVPLDLFLHTIIFASA